MARLSMKCYNSICKCELWQKVFQTQQQPVQKTWIHFLLNLNYYFRFHQPRNWSGLIHKTYKILMISSPKTNVKQFRLKYVCRDRWISIEFKMLHLSIKVDVFFKTLKHFIKK